MTISKHIHSLQQHFARLGLQPVPTDAPEGRPEVFKVCFLNKYEMQRWKEQREQNANRPEKPLPARKA